MTNGSVTKSSARATPARVNATSTPVGPFGPYSASRVSPATIVGSAKGRSMMALRTLLPGNSSRTSTQARSVPITTLTSVTTSEAPTVSFSAFMACRELTSCQIPPAPSSPAFQASAASGTMTTTLRYAVMSPRDSAGPSISPGRRVAEPTVTLAPVKCPRTPGSS